MCCDMLVIYNNYFSFIFVTKFSQHFINNSFQYTFHSAHIHRKSYRNLTRIPMHTFPMMFIVARLRSYSLEDAMCFSPSPKQSLLSRLSLGDIGHGDNGKGLVYRGCSPAFFVGYRRRSPISHYLRLPLRCLMTRLSFYCIEKRKKGDSESTAKAIINDETEITVGYEGTETDDDTCRSILEEKNAEQAVILQNGTRKTVER